MVADWNQSQIWESRMRQEHARESGIGYRGCRRLDPKDYHNKRWEDGGLWSEALRKGKLRLQTKSALQDDY